MNEFKTSDLPLTAYLVIKGFKLLSAKKVSNGRFEFTIEDPGDEASKLAIDYVNSDFCKFDNQIRTIKKILYTS
jgi:hypothetical protein